MLHKSFIPDIVYGKKCIHCIAVNFCTVLFIIFPIKKLCISVHGSKTFFLDVCWRSN